MNVQAMPPNNMPASSCSSSSVKKIAVERAVAACATVQEDIRRDVANVPSKCNAFALLFHVCVTQITLKHCPDDRWTASEICGKVRMGVPPCA